MQMVNSIVTLQKSTEVNANPEIKSLDSEKKDPKETSQQDLNADSSNQSLAKEQDAAENQPQIQSSELKQESSEDTLLGNGKTPEKSKDSPVHKLGHKIQNYFHSFYETVQNYPLICLGTVWGVMAIASFFAAQGLFILEADLESSPSSPPVEQVEPQPTIPWWVFALIPVGCATVGLGMTLILKYVLFPPQKPKRSSLKRRPIRPMKKNRKHPQSAQRRSVPVPIKQPVVTVLPPEPVLNGRSSNLANMMDLRKRHSLSSLLKD